MSEIIYTVKTNLMFNLNIKFNSCFPLITMRDSLMENVSWRKPPLQYGSRGEVYEYSRCFVDMSIVPFGRG